MDPKKHAAANRLAAAIEKGNRTIPVADVPLVVEALRLLPFEMIIKDSLEMTPAAASGPPDMTLASLEGPDLVLHNDDVRCAVLAQAITALLLWFLGARRHVLGRDKAKVRELATGLFRIGGHPAMQMAYYAVQAAWAMGAVGGLGEDDFHPRELEMAWDGIGLWRD